MEVQGKIMARFRVPTKKSQDVQITSFVSPELRKRLERIALETEQPLGRAAGAAIEAYCDRLESAIEMAKK